MRCVSFVLSWPIFALFDPFCRVSLRLFIFVHESALSRLICLLVDLSCYQLIEALGKLVHEILVPSFFFFLHFTLFQYSTGVWKVWLSLSGVLIRNTLRWSLVWASDERLHLLLQFFLQIQLQCLVLFRWHFAVKILALFATIKLPDFSRHRRQFLLFCHFFQECSLFTLALLCAFFDLVWRNDLFLPLYQTWCQR